MTETPPNTSRKPKPAEPAIAPVDVVKKTPMGFWPSTALAVLSGVLYWAAFPGTDLWPFAFVCWAPLLVALPHQTPRAALWLGLVVGLTANVLGFYWLLGMLRTFSGFPIIACLGFMLILCGYQGGRMAFMGWIAARATRKGWPWGTTFTLAFIASELIYPLLFPWFTAAQLHKVPMLLQLADMGGPILVGIAMAGPSVALAEFILARKDKRPLVRRRLAIAATGPIILLVYGAIRMPQVDKLSNAAPKARVAIVQGNLSLSGTEHRDSSLIHRSRTVQLEKENGPFDLVVWSETAVIQVIPESAVSPVLARHVLRGSVLPKGTMAPTPPTYDPSLEVGAIASPLLTGVILQRGPMSRKAGGKMYNSALLVQPDGKVEGIYDKTFLLMFGEYIPFGDTFPSLYEMSPNSGQLSPGASLDAIPFNHKGEQHVITTLICYEDILPSFTNAAVRHANPDLLVNISNDAWFGKTTEPGIHLALAKLRAIEHHRWLVRSTNSGVSAFIDPVGRSSGESPLYEEATVMGDVRWMRMKTGYEIWGDYPWWLCSLIGIGMGFRPRKLRSDSAKVA